MSLGIYTPTYYSNASSESYWPLLTMIASGRQNLREFSIQKLNFNSTKTFINLASFFSGCQSLESFDFGETDTSYNSSLYRMFYNCTAFTGLAEYDATDFAKIKTGEQMFYGCENLLEFNYKTEHLTKAKEMFRQCVSLTNIGNYVASHSNISNFSKVTDGHMMFKDCYKLKYFYTDLSSLATSSQMFEGCYELAHFYCSLKSLKESNQMFKDLTKLNFFKGNLT